MKKEWCKSIHSVHVSGENVLEGIGVTGYILDGILDITTRRETDFALTTLTDFIFLGSKITADGHAAVKCLFLGRNAMTNLDSILKTRHLADKGPYSQSYGFSKQSCTDVRGGP